MLAVFAVYDDERQTCTLVTADTEREGPRELRRPDVRVEVSEWYDEDETWVEGGQVRAPWRPALEWRIPT